MNNLEKLSPQPLWNYFAEICKIPRPSKEEFQVIDFLMRFAKENKLEAKKDAAGNVLIKKPAVTGKENFPVVVLQSHLDMVCEKDSDIEHNFKTDPIKPYVEDGWVKATGTTLGGDDGIGIAAQMAVLTSNEINHGPIECLFTVDEETGLTGAEALKPEFMNGKILLNLDSEDEGELFIGCAGGKDTTITFSYTPEKVKTGSTAYQISVSGLKGGHSGDDIEKGLGNSNKILNRFLWNSQNMFGLQLAVFNGGNLRNAIPREAFAVVTLSKDYETKFFDYFKKYEKEIKDELSITEPKLQLSLQKTNIPDFVIDTKTQKKLLNSLYACPHGVIAMSMSMPGLVETSTNLASVKFIDNNKIFVTTSQRSSVDSSREDIASMVEAVFSLAEADIQHSNGYPGWKPNTNSEILKITKDAHLRLFGNEPKVRAIHAGLECGLFLEKYPFLDMISFGPTIKGAHSPVERLNIESTDKFWKLLVEVLESIPK